MLLAPFSSCCCYVIAMKFGYLYIRSLNGKTPWKKSPPGGETPCLWRTEKPQNCTPKMPNVTSETHRKWCFWLLFPLAAAMNFSYLYIRSPNGKNTMEKNHLPEGRQRLLLLLLCPQRHGPPGRGNTMALKDEQSPKYAFPGAGTSLLKSPTKSLLYVSRGWLLARC